MIVVSYGGGVNSTALLIESVRRGTRPDLILFADTGDERPSTYEYIAMFSEWLNKHGAPPVETVRWIRRDGSFIPLGELSLRNRELPSKAYGYSGCTSKWKQQPIDKRVRGDPRVIEEWNAGNSIIRWIGYDSGEPERADRMMSKNPQPTGMLSRVAPYYIWRCPLVEFDMGRVECEESIRRAGLPNPGKSSCFFCPSMKKHEIDELGKSYPELLLKAIEIEDAAKPTLVTMKGLGRSFSWREYIEGSSIDKDGAVDQDCGCYDG